MPAAQAQMRITPRRIPFTLCVWLLFGSRYTMFCCLWIGYLFFITSVRAHTRSFIPPIGPQSSTIGYVHTVQTRINLPFCSIQEVSYLFELPDTQRLCSNRSYTMRAIVRSGDPVTVVYRTDHPEWSHIQGMLDSSEYVPLSNIQGPLVLFLFVAMLVMFVEIRQGFLNWRILREGLWTSGSLIGMKTVGPMQYRLTISFITEEGQPVTTSYHTCNIVSTWKQKLESPDLASQLIYPVLYLVGNPRFARLECDLQDFYLPDDASTIVDPDPWLHLLAVIPPLLAIGINLAWALAPR